MSDQKWYSVADICKMYDVSQMTVSRWLRDGQLPGAEKKGPYKQSPWRIPQSAINHFEDQLRNAESAS